MDVGQAVADGVKAAGLARDVMKVLEPLTMGLGAAGVKLEHPELRLRCPQGTMEYSSGLHVEPHLLSANKLRLSIPRPLRIRVYGLQPYAPISDAVIVEEHQVVIDGKALKNFGEEFRVDIEYKLEGKEALAGLVYTSSPPEAIPEPDSEENQRYWLHAELKTVEVLRKVYDVVSVEGTEVAVDVTLREDIKHALSPDVRFEIMMQANLSSPDRNVQAKAIAFRRRHPVPKFRGDLFRLTQEAQELFQPSKFQRFLELEGPYRYDHCAKGPGLANLYLPLYIPDMMTVYSATDLTLKDPASHGKLHYKKSSLMKRLKRILEA